MPACSVRRRQPGHHHTAFRLGQRIHPGSALIIFPAKARVDVADGTGLRRCDEVVGISVDPSPIRAAMFNAELSWQPLTSAERRQSSLKAIRFQQGDMQWPR